MRIKEKLNLTPTPVHPKPVRHHGLFGKAFVRQHMVIDEHWTPDSLTEEFKKMTWLLQKHSQYNRLEKKVQQKQMKKTYHSLQKQCRDGRSHLKSLRAGNARELRNILKDHSHMQRLYQKMPLHLVEENINQRTFVMRKERDRLESRLKQLEKICEEKQLERGNLENRISYENEFKLEELIQIEDLNKKLQTSKMRLNAVKAINSTYNKIIEILRHDETFYVPILRSLDSDIEDQSQFISHILHLGSPALVRFKELSEQYKLLDDKVRKSSQERLKECISYRKLFTKPQHKETKEHRDSFYNVRRYVRETRSMLHLKEKFEEIKAIIKTIKIATVCSDEREIYPRIKSEVNNNLKLGSKLENTVPVHMALQTKMKYASVLKGALINNLTDDELIRLEKIEQLKESIKREDEIEENTLLYLKSHANTFVLLRYFLWNLHAIMIHVGRRQMPRLEYPTEYLKLPLLKYEMLIMKACAPDPFEQHISQLFKEVHAKLKLLTNNFNWDLSENSINTLKESYCRNILLSNVDIELQSVQEAIFPIDLEPEIDVMEESRHYKTVLNRSQIKLRSARLVEEHIKKDE